MCDCNDSICNSFQYNNYYKEISQIILNIINKKYYYESTDESDQNTALTTKLIKKTTKSEQREANMMKDALI